MQKPLEFNFKIQTLNFNYGITKPSSLNNAGHLITFHVEVLQNWSNMEWFMLIQIMDTL